MRLLPALTLLSLLLGAVSASAQVPAADTAPYPMEADHPAASPAKPQSKTDAKTAAKPAAKPTIATPTHPVPTPTPKPDMPASIATAPIRIVLPPVRPDAFKTASTQPATGIAAPTAAQTAVAPATTPQPAAVPEHEQELGWSLVTDPATGVQIGLPTKMVSHTREAARGTRWSSTHGEIQVETFRIVNPGLKLSAMFEQEKKEPSTRKVEYSLLRDDSFFVRASRNFPCVRRCAMARCVALRCCTIRRWKASSRR
jgi:hypothetical protein